MNVFRGAGRAWYLLLVLLAFPVLAQDEFSVRDIRVEGLQRISAGTVFNYLPIKVGETLDQRRSAAAVRALFKTGFFKDVRLYRDGDVLVVEVTERPAIARLSFTGNRDLESDDLKESLKEIGFAEGRVFDRALFDRVTQELRRQYFAQGKYAVRIETTVTPMERNRVGIDFDISEGSVARIRQINIVGNEAYEDDELMDDFNLASTGWLSWVTKDDQYSKLKLSGDLESLRSQYLDEGFINFDIESTQVSLTSDKRDVYITINVAEAERYTIASVRLAGELIVPAEELFDLVKIPQGSVFSRKLVTQAASDLSDRLGDEGYAFANVNAVPDIDEQARTVSLTFFVDPGKRVYVRRINFKGNTKTRDEVLRQEMRQMEGAWISSKKVERSKTRLERLGYFETVNVETVPVPGTTDQVDLEFSVAERPSGNLLAGVGFSQSQGVLFNASISQENFLGSGKKFSLTFNNSAATQAYGLGYTDPYYTIDGISAGFNLYSRKTDAGEVNITDYTMDRIGGRLDFGVPLNEFDRVNLGFTVENTRIVSGTSTSREVINFITSQGDEFNTLQLSASWTHDTRNRAIFPDRGVLQRFSGEVALPGGDLEYYKASYRHQWYHPLTKRSTLLLKGEIGYGDAYGDTGDLPFFENYLAGGVRSVRGFDDNTLGPRDSNNDPLGGNLKVVGNAEVILPVPFVKKARTVRLASFFDVGNVYGSNETFDEGVLRASVGVGLTWLSPMGALTFSLAKPINEQTGDEIQNFQFTFGTTF